MNVLLSIKPKYVDEIIAGKKKFEFRKAIFKKRDISKVFIYASSPVKKIVASFEIVRIIEDSPQNLWKQCSEYAGIPEKDFFDYYKTSDIGYAIEITNFEKFSEPIDPYILKKDFRPPQSYCYLPLDYFETKSYQSSLNKDYTMSSAEEKEEYNSEYRSIPQETSQNIQSSGFAQEKVGWEESEVGSIFETVTGNTPSKKKSEYYGSEIPLIKPPELFNSIIGEPSEYLSNKGAEKARVVPEGTVLITCIGNLGRVGLANKKIAFNQQINAIEPTQFIEPKFTYYQVQSLFFKNQLNNLASATTVTIVNKSKFDSIRFIVAPLPEQRAIVSKIEQLFSELDNGITNLKLVQEQLKVYRQAVLDETSKIETFVPITEVIEELGQGWSPKCNKEPSTNDDEWGVIKTTAIQAGHFNERENKKLPKNLEPKSQHELNAGDILITRAGPRVRVGVCCLVKKVRPRLINCDKAYRIKLKKDLIVPEFFEYTMNSAKYTLIIEGLKTGISDSGVNLTQKRFLNMKIPLPTMPEQQAIVQEIETRLSVCDKMEQDIAENLEKAEVLRQSILKKAFEGKLLDERELEEVRNAPDWEPADVLLERVKAEKKGKK
ncbi:restriction endonuclease subunit S [Methanolobus zinderi]|uniref:Restriction endonuclease subunit S n=1 Tax=Methanolobus zinderi TaxID=536044 RepID=A0A7D5I9J0_9EURY|nr:restriction endonuclease subunit S [Methanolobus zinderi]QLC50422.1 restriction endonuclease subunit S [Methanolobus zinderi]